MWYFVVAGGSSLKRPESFDLTDNIGYGVFAEVQQQADEEGSGYDRTDQVGSRRHGVYGGDRCGINEMEYYSVYI